MVGREVDIGIDLRQGLEIDVAVLDQRDRRRKNRRSRPPRCAFRAVFAHGHEVGHPQPGRGEVRADEGAPSTDRRSIPPASLAHADLGGQPSFSCLDSELRGPACSSTCVAGAAPGQRARQEPPSHRRFDREVDLYALAGARAAGCHAVAVTPGPAPRLDPGVDPVGYLGLLLALGRSRLHVEHDRLVPVVPLPPAPASAGDRADRPAGSRPGAAGLGLPAPDRVAEVGLERRQSGRNRTRSWSRRPPIRRSRSPRRSRRLFVLHLLRAPARRWRSPRRAPPRPAARPPRRSTRPDRSVFTWSERSRALIAGTSLPRASSTSPARSLSPSLRLERQRVGLVRPLELRGGRPAEPSSSGSP